VEAIIRYQRLRLIHENAPHRRSLGFRIVPQILLEYGDSSNSKIKECISHTLQEREIPPAEHTVQSSTNIIISLPTQ